MDSAGNDIENRIYLYGAREDKGLKENPNAATFERSGNDITLYGYYGTQGHFGEVKIANVN